MYAPCQPRSRSPGLPSLTPTRTSVPSSGPSSETTLETVGVGLLRSTIDGLSGAGSISNNEVGVNAGVGAMAYIADRVGIRGDVRYLRTVTDRSSPNAVSVDFGGFHFWRTSVGLVWRP
jgi:hypothetical protein